MHVYTKTGDRGETGMIGGSRISKHSTLMRAIGNIDELNSMLAVLRSMEPPKEIETELRQIQNDLFVIGAILADPEKKSEPRRVPGEARTAAVYLRRAGDRVPHEAHAAGHTPKFPSERVQELENQIDTWESLLPPLRNFILPGGGRFSAHVHLSRSICRRAERSIIAQHQRGKLPEELLQYINRLSDWLFTLARFDNLQKKIAENIWENSWRPK